MPKQESSFRKTGGLRTVGGELPGEIGENASPIEIDKDLQDLSRELSFYHVEREVHQEELRRVQEQLEESRLRYLDLYENAPVGYLTFDEQGVVLEMNLRATRLLDVERTLLLNQPFALLIAPESQEAFSLHLCQVLCSDGTQTCELMLRTNKEGEHFFYAQIESIATPFDRTAAIRSVLTDITERKRAEEKLFENRLQLEEAADLAKIAYWEHDGETDEFIFNDAFYGLFGTTAEQEGGYRMPREEYARRFVHPDDLEGLRQQIAENRKRPRIGNREQYEHRGVRPDGAVMHVLDRNRVIVDAEGRVLKIVGVNQDITERKMMEEALRESETKLRAILDASRDAIRVSKNGIHVFVNAAYVSLFGYESADELMGTPILNLIAPESQAFVADMVRKFAAGQPIPQLYELMALRKDGSAFLVEAVGSSYELKGESFKLVILRDVTEKKRLEAQLLQARKMEAIGTLAGGIAHDFNNMLAIILGNAELALDDLESDSGPSRNIRQIVKASKRARDLTKQILTFSRKTERGRRPLKLKPLLEETYDLLRGTLPSTIRMELDIRTESDIVLADPSQIQQILVNLATNAAYAMQKSGGLLAIDLTDITLTGEGQVPDAELSCGRYVKLCVRDTGTGMTEAVRCRVFEPFFTTKGPGKGTGMGLAVVYGIVKNHDGDITVESSPGKLTTFNVYLPLAGMEAGAVRKEAGEIPGGRERLLLVDDEPGVLLMTSKILEGLGYKVTTAPGGTDAWDVFRRNPDSFDLVITDQVMPGLTGMALAKKILKARQDVPVILFTGYSETVSPEEAKAAGIGDFVMKPVTKREVAETVRRVLEKGRQRRKAAG